METDPKGQLGGLECSETMRKRMAGESHGWKCGSCGKSNFEIIKECEEASKENEEEGKREEEIVPPELKMGWKDEMGKEKKDDIDEESAELAEGFVQTVPPEARDAPVQSTYPAARPAQTVPQPTATIPGPVHVPRQSTAQVQRRSNDGVPIWIDRTIAGIVLCLLFMVLKMIFGY